MALSHPGPRAGRAEQMDCNPRPLDVPALAGGWGLPFPHLLGDGRARRKGAASSHPPGSAPTLTLVDGFESAREVTVLAITVHFTPKRRHRNPPTAAARHLGGKASRPLPRKRISEVGTRRRKPVVAKRFGVRSVPIPESVSKTAVVVLVGRNLRR